MKPTHQIPALPNNQPNRFSSPKIKTELTNVMKHSNPTLRSWLLALTAGTALTLAVQAGTTNTIFSFQKGNLTKDGTAYGSGTGYTGVVDGALTDGSAGTVLTTGATSTIGNQYRSPSPNGQQWVGLFSYDLTELNTFIAANTSSSSSVTVNSVSFQLVSAGGNSTSTGIGLYRTDPFTSPGCTWTNYTTGTPWTAPYQNIASSAQYGYTGGGSALGPNLGGTSPNTGVASGSTLTWTSSANFISALTNALARADQKLYLAANVGITTWSGGSDQRLNVNFSPTTTVASRPALVISLAVNALSDWKGTTSSSWATVGNWTAAPGTGDNIRFNASSTANLATVLNQDFNLNGVVLTSPTGPVSIGGSNTLTLGAGGLDLSAATQNLSITAPLVLGAAQTWNVGTGRILSVSGAVTGSGDLTLFGAGKVSLGASNILPNGAGTGNLILNGTLDMDGTSQSVNGLSGSGSVDNTAAGASVLTVGNNNATLSFGGILQNTGGSLAVIKTGSGSLTLSGASTYSGGFTNNGSGYIFTFANTAFGSGPVVSNGGQIYPNATVTFANTLALNGSTLRVGGGGSHILTWNGAVTATGASGLYADGGTGGITLGSTLDITGATFSSYANGTTHNIVGDISGAAGNLNVTGGTLQLAGTGSFTGTTTLSGAAVLRLQPTGTISSSSNIVINGTGNLNIRNTVGWTYSGTITGDGTGSITPTNATNATLAGPISGVASISANSTSTHTAVTGDITGAATAVTVQGGAILTLSGNNSAMGGAVTLNGSTAGTLLNIKSATALGTGNLSIGGGNYGKFDNTSGAALTLSTDNPQAWSSDFTFVGTGDLNLGTGAVTLGGNRAVSVSAKTLTVGGAIGGAYGITKNSGGTLALTGSSSYTGSTIIAQGTLELGAAGSIASSSSFIIEAGATLDTSAQATYAIPGAQPVAFGIDATGSGTSGKIVAAGLDITNAVVTYNFTGAPDDPAYVLATYTSLTGSAFASAPTPPAGYTLDYTYQGNKIALVQAAGYSLWQMANSTAEAINLDHDNDGIANGIEFFLGGTTNTTGFTTPLPGVVKPVGTLSVTWTKAATYPGVYGTDFVVEASTTLVGTWTPAALGTGPGEVEITGNNVKYTFPAGTQNFARLQVTGP